MHALRVVYDPASHTAAWTNISSDIGDQPVNDAVIYTATGERYVSTNFGVDPGRRRHAEAAVAGRTIAEGKNGDRLLDAATHGRGACRLRLK